jgi:hypothetical protein
MKRTLAALPLVALALGLALFLLRRVPSASEAPVTPGTPPPVADSTPVPPSAPLPAPAPATAAPAGEGTIHFVVTLRGRPAAGAHLRVQRSGTYDIRKFDVEADGTQYLRGLPLGPYSVGITYEDALVTDATVVVEGPEVREALIDLKPGGRVFGKVTDKSGHPIAGVRVFLLDQETRAQAHNLEVVTNEEGAYAIRGVAAGLYQARYRHSVFMPLDRSDVAVRGADDFQQVDVVLAMGFRLSGRVVDESGSPVEGASLTATNGSSANTAKSAADGSFTVSALTDVPANISADKPGYGRVVLRNLPPNSTNIVLRLPRPGTLAGRLDMDAAPRKVQVVLSRFDDELRQVIPTETRTFAPPPDGRFMVADIPPGTYWVDVLAEGYVAVDRPQMVIQAGQITPEVSISMRKKN